MMPNSSRFPGALALSFQEVLTASARLRWKRQEPRDTAVFRYHCRQAVDSGSQDARDAGYSAEDVRLAMYAVVAYLDETILVSGDARFSEWQRTPLERELFGTREAAECFYRNLRAVLARPDDADAADLAEVYQLCLMLGFTGMFGPATGERKQLVQRALDKVRRARGPLQDLSSVWRIPTTPRTIAPRRPPHTTPVTANAATMAVEQLVQQAEAKLALLDAGARLRERPALLVLGEPGSVKTSSILHCGAKWEELAGEVHRDGNVASTEHANFWFARSAVAVEAGWGLMADRSQWSRLLEKLQPSGSAPRAALVCFDAERLTRANATEVATRSAQQLREYLRDFARTTGGSVPVYVLFTRSDRIAGFPEFVRKLSHEECARTMGATLPEFHAPGDNPGAYATRLKEAYAGLYRSLAAARVEILARATDGVRIEAAYEFPRELHKLKPVVVRFLSELCPTGVPAGPFLRGFYFSGARPIIVDREMPPAPYAAEPESAPIATAMFASAMDRAAPTSVRTEAPVFARTKIPQWLFLGHLFHEVLLADYLSGR